MPRPADASLAAIDWQAPWLAPFRGEGERVSRVCEAGLPLHEALNAAAGAPPVRFVPQAELPAGRAYEQFIFETGRCPTREGTHDFFNGLCWHRFPRTKARLNALQAAEILAGGIQPARGPVRDALTLFDENAALLQAPPALWDALAARDWVGLFVTRRALWAQARLTLFGHALLEKLVHPRKPITAHVYRVDAGNGTLADVDARVAASLQAPALAAKPFLPLPVLGVPGWWPANGDPAFYEDPAVFRQ